MEFYSQVPNYISESEEEKETTSNAKIPKRRPKRSRIWRLEKAFINKKEALEFVESEKTWGNHYANDTEDGHKIYFRCNKAKLRGNQCPAGVYLFFDSHEENKVELFRTEEEHDHSKLVASKYGLCVEAKQEIEKLFELKLKPKVILEKLREKRIEVNNKGQICAFLKELKQKKYGEVKISLGVFEQFCIDHKEIPDDEDKGFVAAYYVDYDENDELDDDEDVDNDTDDENDGKKFRVFLTTKRLIKNASKSNKIHADATYQLIFEGCPVLMDEYTDLDRHFHPFGINVCSNKKTKDFIFIFKALIDIAKNLNVELKIEILISDASEAIRNAFISVFGEGLLIIMCWAHVRRNVVKTLHLVEK
jgi:hypothetical protein